jgi:HAD superfamily hydrolase (TIGR01548 family)
MKTKFSVIIFDVDGVLVDTTGSFQRTTLETVKYFTGQRVTRRQLHQWKNKPGFNDDWKLSTAWVQSLGGRQTYDEVKRKFVELYWGANQKGNVVREKWLLPRPQLMRLAAVSELAIFTGRVWEELNYTLDRANAREFFRQIVTAEDVKQGKPDPEGLSRILSGRNPATALYVGDNVDDALAAKAAKVRFVGVLRRGSDERRQRGALLRNISAETILGSVGEVEKWVKTASARLK